MNKKKIHRRTLCIFIALFFSGPYNVFFSANSHAVVEGSIDSENLYPAVGHFDKGSCSGSLISPNLVLTSAHCDVQPGSIFEIGGLSIRVLNSTMMQDYDGHVDHDIAIAILENEIASIQPLNLHQDDVYLNVGKTVHLVGFGYHSADFEWDERRRIGVNVIADPIASLYKDSYDYGGDVNVLSYGLIIYGNAQANGRQALTCDGDSGGPAILEGSIVGLSSDGDHDRGPCSGRWNLHTRVDGGSGKNYRWIIDFVERHESVD